MTNARKLVTGDCETDPFKHLRIPKPFLWGLYDGKTFFAFNTTEEFVAFVINKRWVMYAHSGGKFDWMFLLPYVGETRVQIINGRIVSMMLGQCELRDSFSIVPVSMKEIEKEEIEMWKLEETVRHKFTEEILSRNRTDCIYLYNLVKAYRDVAGKQKTIASNALAFSKKLGIDPGKTNARFDRDFRPFFFGGRTQCFKQGSFKNITEIDIHSAYPFAMTHDHPTGNSDDFFRKDDLSGLTDDQISRAFIIIECTARGCFPLRTKTGLEFPHEYNEFHITGWEYLAARDLGLISDVKIQSVRYSNKTINFTDYVTHWYNYKDAHPKKTNPIEYTIGKIMMNSLYGKLAQNPANYFDYKIVKGGTFICHRPIANQFDDCTVCGEPMMKHGWKLEREFGNHEIHIRESLWRFKYRYGIEWEAKGLYKNVATGASITGFTRAHLLRAMHGLGIENIIYCDTDGITCTADAHFENLSFTDKLGDWGYEDRNSPIGHFGGKKLYAIKLSDGKVKLATKGARMNEREVIKLIDGITVRHSVKDDDLALNRMLEIVNGETFLWENPAPSFAIDGSANFVKRRIRRTGLSVTP